VIRVADDDAEPKKSEAANESEADLDAAEPQEEPESPAPVQSPALRTRSRMFKVVLLVLGLGIAAYVGKMGPHEQHVRIILGDQRWLVKAVDLEYVAEDGEVARSAHFTYVAPDAPRIVAHEPQLPDGTYRLRIDVDTREGRRAVERQVTLGGGSTQVDISSALTQEDRKAQ